jgi:hypothetical protein
VVNKAILITLTVPDPRHAEEFNAWYDDEHMHERLAIPGFISARRWTSTVHPGRYLATYELESLAVFESPAYLAHYGDNQTPWSKRNLGRLQVFVRWAAEQANPGDALPSPDATALFVSAWDAEPGQDGAVNAWYDEEHLPLLARIDGCLGGRRFVAASGAPKNVALYDLLDPNLPESERWRATGSTARAQAAIPLVVPGRLRETFVAYPKSWTKQ